MNDFTVPVQRGIEVLDAAKPGWRESVNLDSLELSSSADCVLGQVFGDYSDGLDKISGLYPYSTEAQEWAEEHGFFINDERLAANGEVDYTPHGLYGDLHDAWVDALV